MRPIHRLLLALSGAILFHAPANAAILRVGVGAGCTHADLASAVIAARDGDGIFVNAGTYALANLHFDAKSLTFRGGYASCTTIAPSTDPSATTIDAMDAGSAAIIVGTTDLILDTVTFQNGHADTGGGIRFVGRGRLTLLNVRITSNRATDGAGLDVEANGPTVVTVGAGTLISENRALRHGGGVRLAGDVHLLFVGPQAAIANNTADDDNDGVGDGGGLLIEGPAYADIASPGYDFPGGSWGAISGNVAVYGAGIAVNAGGTLRLVETAQSRGRPTRVESNGDERTQSGGGIDAVASGAHVCGWGFSISGNRAQGIPAISAGVVNTVEIARDVISSPCGSAPVSASGAVDCRAGTACNAIVDNVSISGGSPIVRAGALLADNLEFRRNETLNFGIDAFAVTASNCLVAGNSANTMIFANSISLDECTIAGNTRLAGVISATGNAPSVALSRSIMWEPGVDSIYVPAATQGENITVSDTIAADASAFAGRGYLLSGRVLAADPRFTVPDDGDYHLAFASPAIDYTLTGSVADLDGRPRGIDIHNDPGGRRYDIGAYEYADMLFADGFDP